MKNYIMSATDGPKNFIHNYKLYPDLYKYFVLVYKMELFAKFKVIIKTKSFREHFYVRKKKITFFVLRQNLTQAYVITVLIRCIDRVYN